MNRIYQGRVSKVEVLLQQKSKRQAEAWSRYGFDPQKLEELEREAAELRELTWKGTPEARESKVRLAEINATLDAPWIKALWHHHEVFQDAVNYYTAVLAFLAEGMKDAAGKLNSMGEFSERVKERWEDFPHKGKTREGLRKSLARTLGIKVAEATWEECRKIILAAVLQHFPEGKLQLMGKEWNVFHQVIAEMFPEKKRGLNPQKMARTDWPWLCWKKASGETPAKAYYRKNQGINDFMAEFFAADAKALKAICVREVAETFLTSVEEAEDEDEESSGGTQDDDGDENEAEEGDSAQVERFEGLEAITKLENCVKNARSLMDDANFARDFKLVGGCSQGVEAEFERMEDQGKKWKEEVEAALKHSSDQNSAGSETLQRLSFQKWKTGGKGKDNRRVELFVLLRLFPESRLLVQMLQARLKDTFLKYLVKADAAAYVAFVDRYDLCGPKDEPTARVGRKEPFKTVEDARKKAAKQATEKSESSLASDAGKTKGFTDFIARIRGAVGFVFPGFTSARCFASSTGDAAKPYEPWKQGETDWKEFEFAALEEALKAPNQINKKTEERNKEKKKLVDDLKAFEGKGRLHAKGDDGEEEDHIPGFKDDLRFGVVNKLHTNLAIADGVDPARTYEYGLSQAALRGYEELRDEWNKLVEPEETFSEAKRTKLQKGVLVDHQRQHKDDVGAVLLFGELLKKENWCLWQNPTAEEEQARKEKNHSGNIVRDYLRYLEVKERIAELEKPVQYTPADAALSRRLFDLKGGSQGGFKHGASTGGLWFATQIAVPCSEEERPPYRRQDVRIHYTAPRLLRDGSRKLTEGENLKAANWMQPMMRALDLEPPPEFDLSKHAVSLMPDWQAGSRAAVPERLLLNFVLRIQEEKVIAKLRETMSRKGKWPWPMQFNWNGDKHEATLRWPHEDWSKVHKKPGFPGKWFASEEMTSFRLLSVDLGQKQAGAFAILEVSFRLNAEEREKARYIGTTGERDNRRHWYARVVTTGLMKLPGEDAKVFRPEFKDRKPVKGSGDFRQELSGAAGRKATEGECRETIRLLETMQQVDLLDEDWRHHRVLEEQMMLPDQNAKLLVALRRAQSFAARLHRWCWYLKPLEEGKNQAERRRTALKEIAESDAHVWLDAAAHALAKIEWSRIKDQPGETAKPDDSIAPALAAELKRLMGKLPQWLETIAHRIYHSRRGRHVWEKHPDKADCHILGFQNWTEEESEALPESELMLAGQRGLSMERIEQMEELRKRCQSLNQMWRRDIGGPPPRGRDDSIPDSCPSVLAKLDNMKEQRRNQTAHMILAEALGLRLAKPKPGNEALRQAADVHGEYVKVDERGWEVGGENQKPWRGVVDFIVIEDLSRYRTTQGRAPRENSRLMKWCHRAVRDKLAEMCQPFGVPLVETPAAYSSRFCSRSGVAGFRATELSPPLLDESKWRWRVKKRDDGKEETRLQKKNREQWEAVYAELRRVNKGRDGSKGSEFRTMLVPDAGGSVFVPIANLDQDYRRKTKEEAGKEEHRPVIRFLKVRLEQGQMKYPRLIHADINAAVNLALRAVADPRLWSIHSRLRSVREAGDVNKSIPAGRGSKNGPQPRKLSGHEKPDRFFAKEKRKFGDREGDTRLQIVTPAAQKRLDRAKRATKEEWRKRWLKLANSLELKASDSRNPNFFADIADLRGTHWGVAKLDGLEAGEAKPIHLVSGKALWGYVKKVTWRRISEINAARAAEWERDNLPGLL